MIHLLESRQVVSQLEDNANASAQANFGKGDLDKIIVCLPDSKTQAKAASLLSSSKNLINATNRRIAALRKVKKSVTADLLSGRKRVTV
jgi:Type I restriction modification DNA specificity domain.